VPPIIAALDANQDGKIDASEITNASAALRTLDKNNDGELTMDEIHGPRPGGEREAHHPLDDPDLLERDSVWVERRRLGATKLQ
jgi:hypothetical protein